MKENILLMNEVKEWKYFIAGKKHTSNVAVVVVMLLL